MGEIMTIIQPQFLANEDLVRYQKGACILCNADDFKRKTIIREETRQRRSPYEEWEDHYTTTYQIISDLNIYLICLSFPLEKELDSLIARRREEIIDEKMRNAPKLRAGLERKLKLPADQKKVAIDAIVKDSLLDLEHPKQVCGRIDYSRLVLDDRLAAAKHTLLLGDLGLARGGYRESKGEGISKEYLPRGGVVHHACWPKGLGGIETVRMGFEDFYHLLQKNPVFARYDEAVAEYRDLFSWVCAQPLEVTVTQYNPLAYVRW